ncbi:MAG: hypothetical protein ACYC4H_07780 [Desulfocucumaceae bacterium]
MTAAGIPAWTLDSTGRPYISFFNDTSKDLKCAHWQGKAGIRN